MEATHEKNQTANKWLNDANSTVMDIYNKQANVMLGFYSNLFNSMPGMSKNNWMGNMNFNHSHDGHEMAPAMFPAFNLFKTNNFMNMYTSHCQDMYKQMTDFHNLWSSFGQKKSQHMQENWSDSVEKMQAIIQKEWKVKNEMATTLMEAYNKQRETATELNKKFMEEMHTQFHAASKHNEKFSSDVLKGAHAAEKEEKEHEPSAAKKHAKAEPVHAHSHNHHKQ
jgi:hypothetical protein